MAMIMNSESEEAVTRNGRLAPSAAKGGSSRSGSAASTRSPSPAPSTVSRPSSRGTEVTAGRFAGVYTVVDLRLKFAELDLNCDGVLSLAEMGELLRKGDPTMTDEELALIWKRLDVDADNELDFDEFVDWVFNQYSKGEEEDWRSVDKLFTSLAGKSQLKVRQFTDLCAQCDLYDAKDFGPVDAEALFAKTKKRGAVGLSEKQFRTLVRRVAKKKNAAVETMVAWIGSFAPGRACIDFEASHTACRRAQQ